MDDLLKVRGLNISLSRGSGSFPVAQDICLDVEKGEILGLVGESGCGKTLTTLALTGLLPRGSSLRFSEFFIGGQRVGWSDPSSLEQLRGRKISYIFQEASSALDPLFTIEDQILETIRYQTGLKGSALRSRGREILERVGLKPARTFFPLYPHQLSGGMCQRAMIALSLSGAPDLLIADEPTSALDVATERDIVSLVRDLVREFRLSVIWITHDLSLVRDLARRVAVMYAGRIVETGSAEDVFSAPQHPYTRALLACLPENLKEGRFGVIRGEVPEPAALPTGCAFHPRCDLRMPVCSKETPALLSTTSTHLTRCYLAQKS